MGGLLWQPGLMALFYPQLRHTETFSFTDASDFLLPFINIGAGDLIQQVGSLFCTQPTPGSIPSIAYGPQSFQELSPSIESGVSPGHSQVYP